MKLKMIKTNIKFFVLILFINFFIAYNCFGYFTYKSYVVQKDKGRDILCDYYSVKKNDWVLKLFRQKGEMSQKDFPEFLEIFQRLNPSVKNVDRIRPGENIFIPLKKIKTGSYKNQSSGIVTIPFLTISKVKQKIQKTFSKKHEVKNGEFVSLLISKKFGSYNSQSYNEGMKLFKIFNPKIKNLNKIYTGQKIYIPNPSIQKQTWYHSIVKNLSKDINNKPKIKKKLKGRIKTNYDKKIATSKIITKKIEHIPSKKIDASFKIKIPKITKPFKVPQLKAIASVFDAKLKDKGHIFFENQNGKYKLNLLKNPVIEFDNGKKIIFCSKNIIENPEKEIISSVWKTPYFISLTKQSTIKDILNSIFKSGCINNYKSRLLFSNKDINTEILANWIFQKPTISKNNSQEKTCIMLLNDLEKRTPDPICRYLAQNDISLKEVFADRLNSDKKELKKELKNFDQIEDILPFSKSNIEFFVEDLLLSLNCNYAKNVTISFPYYDIQVDAVTNLITTKEGKSILIDYGSLYGDAITQLENAGFKTVSINNNDMPIDIIKNILNAMEYQYIINPKFTTTKQSSNNIIISIPGILVKNIGQKENLITTTYLNDEIYKFLKNNDLNVVMIRNAKQIS